MKRVMKLVGTLSEFLQGSGAQQPGQHITCYIYRQITGSAKTAISEVTRSQVTGFLITNLYTQKLTSQCFVYRADAELDNLIRQTIATAAPDYSVSTDTACDQTASPNTAQPDDQINSYQLWRVDDAGSQQLILHKFDQQPVLYPLETWVSPDGHEDACAKHAVMLLLADDQLKPLPCHRLLADLAGMDDYEFLQGLQKSFNIRVASGAEDATPRSAREFGLYVAGYWYYLRLIEGTWFHTDPVSDLDVSVVHDNMIVPMLNIRQRQDKRIAFSSADSSLSALKQQVDAGQWQAIWLMPAPAVEQLMLISDLGRLMPANAVCFPPLFAPAAVVDLVV